MKTQLNLYEEIVNENLKKQFEIDNILEKMKKKLLNLLYLHIHERFKNDIIDGFKFTSCAVTLSYNLLTGVVNIKLFYVTTEKGNNKEEVKAIRSAKGYAGGMSYHDKSVPEKHYSYIKWYEIQLSRQCLYDYSFSIKPILSNRQIYYIDKSLRNDR